MSPNGAMNDVVSAIERLPLVDSTKPVSVTRHSTQGFQRISREEEYRGMQGGEVVIRYWLQECRATWVNLERKDQDYLKPVSIVVTSDPEGLVMDYCGVEFFLFHSQGHQQHPVKEIGIRFWHSGNEAALKHFTSSELLQRLTIDLDTITCGLVTLQLQEMSASPYENQLQKELATQLLSKSHVSIAA